MFLITLRKTTLIGIMIINVCSRVIVLGYLFHWFLTAFLTLLFCLTQVNRSVPQREEMEIQHSTTRVYEFTASLISPLLALVSLYYNALRVCMESILPIPNSSVVSAGYYSSSCLAPSQSLWAPPLLIPIHKGCFPASVRCCSSNYSSFV